jgi:hypothetical protein
VDGGTYFRWLALISVIGTAGAIAAFAIGKAMGLI